MTTKQKMKTNLIVERDLKDISDFGAFNDEVAAAA